MCLSSKYFPLTLQQGVRQVKNTDLNPVYLFISPPSLPSLKSRLTGRGTDSDSSIQKRLTTAIREIQYAQEGPHDIVIVNDDLDRTYDQFKRVALGEDVAGDALPRLLEEVDKLGLENPTDDIKRRC